MRGRVAKINVLDLANAIDILENHPNVISWSITRITDPMHSSVPIGRGFGIMIAGPNHSIWEKAGSEKSVVKAVEKGIRRLNREGELNNEGNDNW